MTPRRSASPSVAMPMSQPFSSTKDCKPMRVLLLGAGRRPPNRASRRSWITSTSHRAVIRMVCRAVLDTPNMGSSTTRNPRERMASMFTERMMESR